METIVLDKTSLEDKKTITLLKKIFAGDRGNKFIWNISDRSLAYESTEALVNYLRKDFERYLLFIAYHNNSAKGLFAALNISEHDNTANLIVWIDKRYRSRTFVIKWWIYFLLSLQQHKISRLYARILKRNTISINAAMRYGFVDCDFLESSTDKSNADSRRCMTRSTELNEFERHFLQDRCSSIYSFFNSK